MRTVWLIPIFASLLIGAGCALTQSQGDQAVDPKPAILAAPSPAPTPVKTMDAKLPPAEPTNNPPNNPLPTPRIITMKAGDFFFDPKSISVKAGETVTITFTNSTGHHDFSIDELGLRQPISAGGSVTITAPSTPGRYAYYCSIGAHRTLGMEGTLVVE